jgi:hypothetical protein
MAWVATAGMAWAQEAPKEEAPKQDIPRAEAPRPDRGADFWVNLLKDRLKLNEEQAAKVKEIVAKDSEERAKADEARNAKIAEVLDEEQKKQFEELRRNPLGNLGRMLQGLGRGGAPGGGPPPGGGPGAGPGGGGLGAMAGRLGQVNVDDLKRELDLTDEQMGKIRPLVDEFNEKARKRWEELREGNFRNFNWQEELQKIQEMVKEAGDKLKPHLTPEQKEKYDQLVETRLQWVRMAQGFAGARGGTPTPGGAAPRPSPEERLRRVMEALKIENENERKAVSDLVAEIIRAQAALEDQNKAVQEKLQVMSKNSELSSEAIEDALKEVRKDRRQKEKELAGLQKELSEAVNNRQEVELILQGILK